MIYILAETCFVFVWSAAKQSHQIINLMVESEIKNCWIEIVTMDIICKYFRTCSLWTDFLLNKMCSNLTTIIWIKRLRCFYHRLGLGHFVLACLYFGFIIIGAFIFYVIENQNETSIRQLWADGIDRKRKNLIRYHLMPLIFNNSEFYLHLSGDKTHRILDILHK